MRRNLIYWVSVLVMSIVVSKSVAEAGIQSVAGGLNAPASALGPYTMSSFNDDLRLTSKKYSYVESPLTGNVEFYLPLEHQEISSGWITWSHGYNGDVYWTSGDEYFVTLTLPVWTSAFYFYAEPKNVEVYEIVADAYDELNNIVQISQDVKGDFGACYYGFYGTDGSVIKNINIYSDEPFAIGEFGISMIPAPEAFLLCNIGLCTVMELKRRGIFEQNKV